MAEREWATPDYSDERSTGEEQSSPPNAPMDVAPELFTGEDRHNEGRPAGEDRPP